MGDLAANLDAMDAAVAQYPIVCWKVFTNFPDLYDGSGNAWRLDDSDPALARVGEDFVRHAVDLGVPTIAAHKGLSTTLGYRSPHANPFDVGPAARLHRDARFLVYHSGFEADVAEGPYDPSTRDLGVNRLVTTMLDAGIGPNENVYAELGTTWWSLLARPEEAAHVLGKLLRYIGEDNVLWGTDAVFYGSPQGQIQAFRAFAISEQFQEQFGYPALSDDIKRKVLGLNALRLHDVDPVTVPCAFSREDLERLRLALPVAVERRGPRNSRELRAFVAASVRSSACDYRPRGSCRRVRPGSRTSGPSCGWLRRSSRRRTSPRRAGRLPSSPSRRPRGCRTRGRTAPAWA